MPPRGRMGSAPSVAPAGSSTPCGGGGYSPRGRLGGGGWGCRLSTWWLPGGRGGRAAGGASCGQRATGSGHRRLPMDEVIVTYLEMRACPSLVVTRPHRSGMLLRLEEPTTAFYRYLYETVGSRWGWHTRAEMTDTERLP